jgi:UDP-4-amino-4,6-dideoxy-N-acetyl-beta-L-altrosamine transaminase
MPEWLAVSLNGATDSMNTTNTSTKSGTAYGTRNIHYGHQLISDADVEAVVDALRSDFLTQGPLVGKFEDAMKNYCGSAFGIAVSNATAALHIACLALGLGPGDLLWTAPNTFVASANCALYCGADVDFVDIDARTYNMSIDALRSKLEQAKRNNRLPKIVIPVHFSGQACDMQSIKALSREYGFKIIEDASHAIGGRYINKPVGNCEYSDLTVFSFHPVKIITTGEGGMVMTNSPDLAQKLYQLRSHGITRDTALMVGEPDGAWDYQQLQLGFNYRLTDIQCALGLSQLACIDDFIASRQRLASSYDEQLAGLPVTIPYVVPDSFSAWHLYVILLDTDLNSGSDTGAGAVSLRRRVFEKMRESGIGVNVHYKPVHLQPYYKKLGFGAGDFPLAERYYERVLTLPLHCGLSDADQQYVVNALRSCFC